MIRISEKFNCCGCEACSQRCPKQCIEMRADNEGFLYPVVDVSRCINCGLCEKVCPELNKRNPGIPLKVVAAKANSRDIVMQSSSGGIFSLLAVKVINKGGVVFGARFDENWNVVHDYTESLDGLEVFRRSKYVQSRIGNTFEKAEEFLKSGRMVLFTGTPCQINGLKLFLHKNYENLLAVDIACHGVPSPSVWNIFLREYLQGIPLNEISSINFRDKKHGWENYCFTVKLKGDNINKVVSSPYRENIYMRAFLKNLIIRPSCENCCAKTPLNASDLTIGDFWGIKNVSPDFYDENGVSIIICNTNNGVKWIEALDMVLVPADFELAKQYNGGFFNSPNHRNRLKYFKGLQKERKKSFREYTERALRPELIVRLKRKLKRLFSK